MERSEMVYLAAVVALSACLVAATNSMSTGGERLLLFPYWLIRFGIEGGLFVAFRSLLETGPLFRSRPLTLFAIAFLLSLVPFVLATTAFDIVLGFPELGLENAPVAGTAVLREFLLEIAYLADDHLSLCLLLSLPRFIDLLPSHAKTPVSDQPAATPVADPETVLMPLLDSPLQGSLIRLEAQEHYVIVVTDREQRMVLGRFSDYTAMLSSTLGLQVHRSHWVALRAVAEVFEENRNMKLRLTNGDVVPVSRRHRTEVSDGLANRAPQS